MWPNGYDPDNDLDYNDSDELEPDYLPDDLEPWLFLFAEPPHPYEAEQTCTYPDTIGYNDDQEDTPLRDTEDICMRSLRNPNEVDVLWTNRSADDEDWACPGKNWKGAQP
jgi:hypothetical protein